MNFFQRIFSSKKKIEKVIEDKVESRFVTFETKLENMLKESFERIGVKSKPDPVLVSEGSDGAWIVDTNNLAPEKVVVMVNDTIKCFFTDGTPAIEGLGDKELYKKVVKAYTIQEIKDLLIPHIQKKEQEEAAAKLKHENREKELVALKAKQEADIQAAKDREEMLNAKKWEYCAKLVEIDDFEIVDGELRMAGIPLSIPKLLVDEFVMLIDNIYSEDDDSRAEEYDARYDSLKNFWMWCSLNPNPQARHDLFKFLENHDLGINKNGFFFTYRRVILKDDVEKKDVELMNYLSEQYLKIKTKWKKNVNNFNVIRDQDGCYNCLPSNNKTFAEMLANGAELLGTLGELFANAPKESAVEYTDAHTRTFTIKIGEEVRMDREECDSNHKEDCGKGLHSGNKNFGFSSFGDTKILCLINPADVVSVPYYDCNKMRSCAYLPVAVLEHEPEAKFLESASVVDLADDYMIKQVRRLCDMVAQKTDFRDINPYKIPEPVIVESIVAESGNEFVEEGLEAIITIQNHMEDVVEDIKANLKKRVVKI